MEVGEVEVPPKIEELVVAEEVRKKAEEGSISRYEALFLKNRRPLSLEEAREITWEPKYLQVKPSTNEISPYTSKGVRKTIEDIRDIFTFVRQHPQLLENFSNMVRRSKEESHELGYERSRQERFNEWLDEISEKAKGFGVALELNNEERRRICEEMWKDTDLGHYFEDLPKHLFELRSGKLVGTTVPITVIELFADQYFQAVYMASLMEGVKDLMREYYPELVADWSYRMGIDYIGGGGGAKHKTIEGRTHLLVLEAQAKGMSWTDWAHAGEKTIEVHPEDNFSLRGLNRDFKSFLHELAHAKCHEITGEITIQPHDPDIQRKKKHGLDSTLDEGFAVMVELHVLKRMIEDSDRWGLEEKDIHEFESLRRDRLSWLRREKNRYTEGTLKIFHGIFKQGGVKGMIDFLQRVDWRKCARIGEKTPEYEAALNDPGKIPMKPEASAITP